jgi:hypothetical protein
MNEEPTTESTETNVPTGPAVDEAEAFRRGYWLGKARILVSEVAKERDLNLHTVRDLHAQASRIYYALRGRNGLPQIAELAGNIGDALDDIDAGILAVREEATALESALGTMGQWVAHPQAGDTRS